MRVKQFIIGLCLFSFLYILPITGWSENQNNTSFLKKTIYLFHQKIAQSIASTLGNSFILTDGTFATEVQTFQQFHKTIKKDMKQLEEQFGMSSSSMTITTVSQLVITNGDDAEENRSTGNVETTSSDLELVDENGTTNQLVGMRFLGMNIPQNARITNAYIQFTADVTNGGIAKLYVKGHDTSSPSGFGGNFNISNRDTTTSSALWKPAAWNTADSRTANERSSDLTSVIQEIVSRDDWSSGNDIAMIITGVGEREAESYDGASGEHADASRAPELFVTYDDATSIYVYDNETTGTLSAQSDCNTTLSRTFTINDNIFINDLDVGLNIEHTYRGDVRIQLQSPQGTIVTLKNQDASGNDADDHLDVLLDDEAINNFDDNVDNDTGAPVYGDDRTAIPDNPLSAFDGENASGTWTMTFCNVVQGTNTARDLIFNSARLYIDGNTANGGGNPVGNLSCAAIDTEITGTVFEDVNYNGLYDSGEYLGVDGIVVTATDALGSSTTTMTDLSGNFTLSNLNANSTYRIEFTNLPSWASPTFYGEDNGTLVQFVQAGNCANLALADPADYCEDDPTIATACYGFGPRTGSNSSEPAILTFKYSSIGGDADGRTAGVQAHPVIATIGEVGTTYGIAFDQLGNAYAAAYVKRHADIGPGGTGMIYKITPAGVVSQFVDLGVTAGGTNPHASTTNWNRDVEAFDAVGKRGLGDMDFDPETNTLYTVGLANKSLYKINLPNGTVEGPFAIPVQGCSASDDWRPFAVEVHKGEIYVGGTCSAQSSGNPSDISISVLKFNSDTETFSAPIFSFSDFANNFPRRSPDAWEAWTSTFPGNANAPDNGENPLNHPQPFLTDIEFLGTDLLLGIKDRLGDQTGVDAQSTDTNDNKLYDGRSLGDILRACGSFDNGWVAENNGVCGTLTSGISNINGGQTSGAGNDPTYDIGPGGANNSEFYDDNHEFDFDVALGGLLQLATHPEQLLSTMYDPIQRGSPERNYPEVNGDVFFNSGIRYLNNSDGSYQKGYIAVFSDNEQPTPFFGKASGVGDIGANCQPAPIEIGNYVWEDTNGDGIQTAGESGLANIRMELYDDAGNLLAIDTTNTLGQYYFSGKDIDNATWLTANDTIQPNTSYYVVAGGNGQFSNGVIVLNNSNYQLTQENINSGANRFEIDSDGTIANGIDPDFNGEPYLLLTTTNAGQADHSADFGFKPPCGLNITTSYSDNCTGDDTNGYTADWHIGISVLSAPDNSISYQRNSEAIQTHTLAGSTDTIIISGIPADGGSNDIIRIYFTNDTACGDTIILKRPTPCPVDIVGANSPAEVCENLNNTQIGGTAFEDWNYDGAMNQLDTIGVQGIQVDLYDDCGNITQTTYTDKNGNYLFNSLTVGTDYRVEFTLPESVACWAKTTKAGPDNGTTVQFVQPGNCASLGVASPGDYCDDMPRLVISCYENGEASTNMNPALISFSYEASGLPAAYDGNTGTNGTGENPVPEVNIAEIGAVNGSAWQAGKSRLFSATFLKRFVGFLDGPGYIYTTEFVNGSAAGVTKFNLNGVSPANGGSVIDFGTVCRDASCANNDGNTGFPSDYELANSPIGQSIDLDAFAKVGAMSYGDIDMQEDGNTLWAVNLFQKALISIDVSGNTGSLPGTVNQYLLSDLSGVPTCSNGQIRPWGLAFDKGVGYLGLVCDASVSLQSSDLEAYILAFDPNNISNGFRTVLNFSLDFPREIGHITGPGFPTNMDWLAWASDWNTLAPFTSDTDNNYMAPQPIIGDIAFNEKGDMVIGFMDRFGHQNGRANKIAVSQTNEAGDTNSGGDLIHACFTGSGWILEGSSACMNMDNNITGDPFTQLLQNDGPNNNGEFYFEDHLNTDTTDNSRFLHAETSTGLLSLTKGRGEVISLHYDPLWGPPSIVNAQGIVWHNTYTGERKDQYQVVESSGTGSETFAKANGLGDLQAMCAPAPIEIGNYVWEDTDGDGIQDACENPISGVIVSLYKNGTKIAETQTSTTGQYYFSDKNAIDSNLTWTGTGGDTMLLANMEYKIVFGESQYANGELTIGSEIYNITTQNEGVSDSIDSDAMEMDVNGTILPSITATTGDYGCADHSFDVGFVVGCPPEICLPIKVTIKKNNRAN